jgi:alpha-tubulin suppressor-like RCC1 family protein
MATNFLINGSEFSDNFIPKDRFTQGGLWCWGYNGYYQFGDGAVLTSAVVPISPNPGKDWKQISVGDMHSGAIKTNGTLWNWGYNSYRLAVGDVGSRAEPTQVGVNTNWQQVSCGKYISGAVKSDGTLWVWGGNSIPLGNGLSNQLNPTQITGTNWKLISAGGYHFAGIKTDGTLWTWGANYYGENGDGTTTYTFSPNQVPGTNWKLIDTGNYYSAQLGIKTDGTLWSWGRNHYGQLGDGTGTNRSSPVQIAGTTWKMAVSFKYHCAGIKTDGTLWTWGDNTYGQLGDGTTTGRNSPVQIAGTNWKTVGLKDGAMSAIKTDGTLWSWGGGFLGDNTSNSYSSPVQIYGGGTNWKMVTGGNYYMLAIRDDF